MSGVNYSLKSIDGYKEFVMIAYTKQVQLIHLKIYEFLYIKI